MSASSSPPPTSRPAIGLDVGGTAVKAVVCTADGRVLARHEVATPAGARGLMEVLAQVVAELEQQTPDVSTHPVVGLCVPGIIDDARGVVVQAVNLGWQDEPLAAQLAQRLGRPAVLGHDVRAGALAELRWGAARGRESVMFVALGTGIATALLLDGRPVVNGGYAGETGHVLVRDPRSGERVVLERLCSAAAIGRRWRERRGGVAGALPGGGEAGAGGGSAGPRVVEVATSGGGDDGLPPGSRQVFAAAAAGDEQAAAVIAEAVEVLADALAGQLSLLGPVPVVIGGGLSGAGSRLVDPLRAAVEERLVITGAPPVTTAELGSWAGAMGSAALALAAGAPGSSAAVAWPGGVGAVAGSAAAGDVAAPRASEGVAGPRASEGVAGPVIAGGAADPGGAGSAADPGGSEGLAEPRGGSER